LIIPCRLMLFNLPLAVSAQVCLARAFLATARFCLPASVRLLQTTRLLAKLLFGQVGRSVLTNVLLSRSLQYVLVTGCKPSKDECLSDRLRMLSCVL
jgi:hypothetical protein